MPSTATPYPVRGKLRRCSLRAAQETPPYRVRGGFWPRPYARPCWTWESPRASTRNGFRQAVRGQTGKDLDELAASELTPLVERAARKVQQACPAPRSGMEDAEAQAGNDEQ